MQTTRPQKRLDKCGLFGKYFDQIISYLPYSSVIKLTKLLISSPKLRLKLLGPRGTQTAPLHAFLQHINQTTESRRAEIEHLLVNDPLFLYRLYAFANMSTAKLNRWAPVSGLNRILQAQRQNKGICLVNSHFGALRAVPFILERHGYSMLSIESRNFLKRFNLPNLGNIDVAETASTFPAKILALANERLKNGGIVHIFADGGDGNSVCDVMFFDKQWSFRRGFASMVIDNDALALPVFAVVDSQGRVKLEILPALDNGPPNMAKDERVRRLIEQYATLLEQMWRSHPGNVTDQYIGYFHSLPYV